MAAAISEALPKFTVETLKLASKQSQRCHVVSEALRSAIDRYIREQEPVHMKRKVLSLTQSFEGIKEANLLLPSSTSRELVEDPLKAMERSQRWKVNSCYGDVGLRYQEDQTLAYVAARMPAVYSALYRVLSEVKRRVPDLSPTKVLDFGGGTGSALWAMMEVWPGSLKQMNMVEPSQSMQRAGLSLLKDLDDLPLIHSYDSIESLTKHVRKPDRQHNVVIASHVLGEIPSLKDRITLVRQLWNLTDDILVLVEPGSPQGSNIISQMRSHILWMEKRRTRKLLIAARKSSKELMPLNTGAFVVAPCPHDGPCPLRNTGKYCHFVQRLERTPSQRQFKWARGTLRGFEDEKFCYIAIRRGTRPRESWPLDGMKFDTLKEMREKKIPENLEVPVETNFSTIDEEEELEDDDILVSDEEELDSPEADLGTGWGRIIYMPMRRGNRVELDVCRATNCEGTDGSFDRIVVTQRQNPSLHHQARRSIWGDLWPLRSRKER